MALSAGAANQNATTSRVLNKLNYALANIAADITTATTSDIALFLDADDNYELKYGDATNLLEMIGTTATATELNYLDIATLGTGAASKAVVLDAGEDYTWPATGVLTYGVLNDGTTALAASALEINRTCDVSGRLVAGGSALALTEALHDGKTVLWDTAAGTALTLPASSGSGAKFRCVVSVTATSNSHTLACAGSDMFVGSLTSIDTDTSDATLAFAAEAADTFDTITFNRTTTGLAAIGDWVEVQDIVTGSWAVTGVFRASGTVATPFSAS